MNNTKLLWASLDQILLGIHAANTGQTVEAQTHALLANSLAVITGPTPTAGPGQLRRNRSHLDADGPEAERVERERIVAQWINDIEVLGVRPGPVDDPPPPPVSPPVLRPREAARARQAAARLERDT